MSIPPEKLAELRIKHLEMVQSVIARIASYGAAIKNWCITVTTAVCGFSISSQKPFVAFLALLPIATFSLLDAQYLRVERRFRTLFDQLRREDWGNLPSFDVSLNAAPNIPYRNVLGSWSVISFYVPLALGVAILMIILASLHGWGI
jgi:hypothetical protein